MTQTTPFSNGIEWILLILIALITIFSFIIFRANAVLLSNRGSKIEKAALGDNGKLQLGLNLMMIFISAISVSWLVYNYQKTGINTFNLIIGLIVFIQLFLLPVYHGVLYADKKVWVVENIPEFVDLVKPVGIVHQSSKTKTYYGRNSKNELQLVTVVADEVKSCSVSKVLSLKEFIKNYLKHEDAISIPADTKIKKPKSKKI